MAPDNSNMLQELAGELIGIRLLDHVKAYDDRNRCIVKAVWLALMSGLAAGFRFDPAEPEWPVAFIELPSLGGEKTQVSWHIPQHSVPWDGHDTTLKYERTQAFVDSVGE